MSKIDFKILRITADEFTNELTTSEITLPPVLEEYPHSDILNKVLLQDHEWQKLAEETNLLASDCKTDLNFVGGTRSSARVRRAKAHLDTLVALKARFSIHTKTDLPFLIETTETALKIARDCLKRHNAQPKKFITYDLETGKALNEPDYSNVDQAEILKSLGMAMSPQPNRAERRKMKRKGVLH